MSGPRAVLAFVGSDHADTPYDVWAREFGVEAHLFVSAEKAAGYAHVPGVRSFAPYAADPVLERAALECALRVRPGAVLARMEGDLLRAARLRELTGIPGQDTASALAFRDKVLMKSLAAAAGIGVPRFVPVRTGYDLHGFVREHGWPVVVKPALGSGSAGTVVLRDDAGLDALLAAGLPEHPEAEEFVEGPMYVVDGLVAAGRPRAVFVSRYLNDCLAYRDGDHLGSVQLTRDHPMTARLAGFASRVLAALPVPPSTTFHLEVWHTPDDRLVLCEVASRTGGALTTAAITAAAGYDLDRAWFAAQVAGPDAAPAREPGVAPGHTAGWVVFYPRAGRLVRLPSGPPAFVVTERHRAEVGTRYGGGIKSGHFASGYVVTGRDADEVERNTAELARWYDTNVIWED